MSVRQFAWGLAGDQAPVTLRSTWAAGDSLPPGSLASRVSAFIGPDRAISRATLSTSGGAPECASAAISAAVTSRVVVRMFGSGCGAMLANWWRAQAAAGRGSAEIVVAYDPLRSGPKEAADDWRDGIALLELRPGSGTDLNRGTRMMALARSFTPISPKNWASAWFPLDLAVEERTRSAALAAAGYSIGDVDWVATTNRRPARTEALHRRTAGTPRLDRTSRETFGHAGNADLLNNVPANPAGSLGLFSGNSVHKQGYSWTCGVVRFGGGFRD